MTKFNATERLELGDALYAEGRMQEARDAYLSYTFWLEDEDVQPDFDFYRRLADCQTAVGAYGLAMKIYDVRLLEVAGGDSFVAGLAYTGMARVFIEKRIKAEENNRKFSYPSPLDYDRSKTYNAGHQATGYLSRAIRKLLDLTMESTADLSADQLAKAHHLYALAGGPSKSYLVRDLISGSHEAA